MGIFNMLIELSKIKEDPPLALLLNNHNRSIERASRTSDRTHSQKFINFFINNLFLPL